MTKLGYGLNELKQIIVGSKAQRNEGALLRRAFCLSVSDRE